MPIYDLGYRAWNGPTNPGWMRPVVIARTGVSLVWKSRWLRWALLLAWVPVIYFAGAFFMYEQLLAQDEFMSKVGQRVLSRLVGPNVLDTASAMEDPNDRRSLIWSYLIASSLRYPQNTMTVLVVGLIAPALISRDIRSRAFLIYFARPITRVEYLLGKAATVWAYIFMITTLPALVLYLLALGLSPQGDVVLTTWELPLRILVSSVVIMLPTTMLALAFSSLVWETRSASFLWFATWGLGYVMYWIMWSRTQAENIPFDRRWTLCSLYHTLAAVHGYIFGLEDSIYNISGELILLATITVVSTIIVFVRISAPMRA